MGFGLAWEQRFYPASLLVKMPLLVSDLFEFLQSNPRELDWKKTNIAAIGQRLVQDNETKYLGEKVSVWKEALKPRKSHWDTRTTIEVPADASDDAIQAAALESAHVQRHLEGREPRKVIVVPGRLVNIVG